MSDENIPHYKFSNKNFNFKTYSGAIEGTDAAGGYTVPSELARWYVDYLDKNSWARQLFEVRKMTNKTLDIPKITSGDTIYLGGEGLDMTTEGGSDQSSSSYTRPTFGQMTLTAKKFNGLTGYSTELDEDSYLNISEIIMEKMMQAFVWYEEQAFIQGEESGTKFSWTAGDVRYAWDGLIDHVPGTSSGTGGNWTPDDSSPENWIDAGSSALTYNHLLNVIAKIEAQRGLCDTIFVNPTLAARLRDPNEFEMLQSAKDVGLTNAALIKGFVGRFYTADIFVSHFLPQGVSVFNTGTDDTLILGMDRRSPVIGDRRLIEVRGRHNFYEDVEELRVTERIAFNVYHNQLLAGVADVKASI